MDNSDDEDADQQPDHDDDYDDEEQVMDMDYHTPGSVFVMAAESEDMHLYFVSISGNFTAETDTSDFFGHPISAGQDYISGFYLEKKFDTTKGTIYKINKGKEVFFFKESQCAQNGKIWKKVHI